MNADLNLDYRRIINRNEIASGAEEINVNGMDEMKEMGVVSDKCNCSGFSLSAIGGAILMFAGILIYTLIAG